MGELVEIVDAVYKLIGINRDNNKYKLNSNKLNSNKIYKV